LFNSFWLCEYLLNRRISPSTFFTQITDASEVAPSDSFVFQFESTGITGSVTIRDGVSAIPWTFLLAGLVVCCLFFCFFVLVCFCYLLLFLVVCFIGYSFCAIKLF
jgi:hypothetical protein